MGDSKIEWTNATWNPVIGCARISEGCRHCYAERQAARIVCMSAGRGQPTPYEGLVEDGPKGARWTGEARFVPSRLVEPLHWRKPRRVFVNSMSDLFHEGVAFEEIAACFGVMAASPQHTFQVLTKRPERAAEFFEWAKAHGDGYDLLRYIESSELLTCAWETLSGDAWGDVSPPLLEAVPSPQVFGDTWPLPNVWLGVSCENQAAADERIPILVELPAAVRFVSAEPLLGPIDRFYSPFSGAYLLGTMPGLDWIIVGGESGPGARPCDVAWVRSIVEQCRAAGVACFVKQLGARPYYRTAIAPRAPEDDRLDIVLDDFDIVLDDRKGSDPSEWPEDLRVREFPGVSESGGADA